MCACAIIFACARHYENVTIYSAYMHNPKLKKSSVFELNLMVYTYQLLYGGKFWQWENLANPLQKIYWRNKI